MRATLSLHVSRDRVIATLSHRAGEARVGEQAHSGPANLALAVGVVLADVAAERPRAKARVRLDYPFAQVKRLERLPSVSPRVATRIVRANSNAFFIKSPGGHAIPEVCRDSTGALWAAVFDGQVIADVVAALLAHGLTVSDFRPSRELLQESFAGDAGSFVWRPPPAAASRERNARIERTFALTSIVLAAAAAVLAPAIRARQVHARLAADVGRSEQLRDDASRARGELASATTALNAIKTFASQRRALTTIFASIGAALPDSTALTTIRIDSIEASFVAVSPHVVNVLGAVGDALDGQETRITSAITREQVGGVTVERATFRARRPRSPRGAQTSSRSQTSQ